LELVEVPTHGARTATGRSSSERAQLLIGVGYAIAAGTVVVQSAAHVIGVRLLDDRVWNLNADNEGNALTWAGSAATFTAALAAFVLALVPREVDRRLLALSLLLAAFSVDDAIGIHERLAVSGADALDLSADAGRAIWPVVYLPALVAALLLLLEAARRGFGRAGRMVRHGIALLVVAMAAELTAAFATVVLDVRRGSWPDVVEVVIEEGAELGAWLLIAFGLTAALIVRASEEGSA
jgi:hypothetical protein